MFTQPCQFVGFVSYLLLADRPASLGNEVMVVGYSVSLESYTYSNVRETNLRPSQALSLLLKLNRFFHS